MSGFSASLMSTPYLATNHWISRGGSRPDDAATRPGNSVSRRFGIACWARIVRRSNMISSVGRSFGGKADRLGRDDGARLVVPAVMLYPDVVGQGKAHGRERKVIGEG